jgi:hypothetical protein
MKKEKIDIKAFRIKDQGSLKRTWRGSSGSRYPRCQNGNRELQPRADLPERKLIGFLKGN